MKEEVFRIRSNNAKGFEPVYVGDILDISYIGSKTRRGRVQRITMGGGVGEQPICPALTANDRGLVYVEEIKDKKT